MSLDRKLHLEINVLTVFSDFGTTYYTPRKLYLGAWLIIGKIVLHGPYDSKSKRNNCIMVCYFSLRQQVQTRCYFCAQ